MEVGRGIGRGMLSLSLALVASLAGLFAAQAGAAVYWTDNGAIGRMNLDGTNPSPGLVPRTAFVGAGCGLAVDGSHIYWADRFGDAIGRADLEGNNLEPAFITGADEPCGVALRDGYIYWANYGGDSIGRARIDGTEVNQEFVPGASRPCGVAVNEDFIYWAGGSSSSYVGRALRIGGDRGPNIVEIEPRLDYALCGVAADEQHVFWGSYGDSIGRVGANGSDPEPEFVTNVQSPCSVAIGDGKLYFGEISQWWNGLGHISRVNLDGTGVDRELAVGLTSPCGIAVDSLSFGPAYVAVPPLPPWTPCKIDQAKVNKWNGSALVRLHGPAYGSFRVKNRSLGWRVLSKRPPQGGNTIQASWNWWIGIKPRRGKGRAARGLRRRLANKGHAPLKLRIDCSQDGAVDNHSIRRLVLHKRGRTLHRKARSHHRRFSKPTG